GSPVQINSDTDSVVDILQSMMIHNNVPIPQQTLYTQKEDLSLELMVAEKIQNIPAISFYPEALALLAAVNIGGGSQKVIIRADNRAAVTKPRLKVNTFPHHLWKGGEIWAAMRSAMDKQPDIQYQIEWLRGTQESLATYEQMRMLKRHKLMPGTLQFS
ncbi:hypothetical protein BJ742DRAFT_833592, partial [Cladochytrium replicatum]